MEKVLGFKNYGSTPHLLNSRLGKHDKYITQGQHDIIFKKPRKGDLFLVTEKYDGTNAGVARVNGQLVALTRSGYLAKESEYEHYRIFAEWVQKYNHLFKGLPEGYRVIGEWMSKRISLLYTIHGEHALFVAYDGFNASNKRCEYISSFSGVLARGIAKGNEALNHDELCFRLFNVPRNQIYTFKPEGYVVKVFRNGVFDYQAKWVRDDFEAGLFLEDSKVNPVI